MSYARVRTIYNIFYFFFFCSWHKQFFFFFLITIFCKLKSVSVVIIVRLVRLHCAVCIYYNIHTTTIIVIYIICTHTRKSTMNALVFAHNMFAAWWQKPHKANSANTPDRARVCVRTFVDSHVNIYIYIYIMYDGEASWKQRIAVQCVKRKINEPSNAYADIRTLLKPKQLVRAVWMSRGYVRVCVSRVYGLIKYFLVFFFSFLDLTPPSPLPRGLQTTTRAPWNEKHRTRCCCSVGSHAINLTHSRINSRFMNIVTI